jgi:hypothetical protein
MEVRDVDEEEFRSELLRKIDRLYMRLENVQITLIFVIAAIAAVGLVFFYYG